ncbi:MAG: radical SAM protein [Planctomycetaceae bacterium]|nr:radical SAM protein [Planctomycetaceae bacterium]
MRLIGSLLRNAFRSRIERLILYVTTRCPLNCRHCFVDKTSPIDRELTVDEARSIAATLNPLTWLDIGGGEPFLREDIEEICSHFKAVEISIPTNGWFVEQTLESARRLHRSLGDRLSIAVSLDGFGPTHDRLRGQGSFERAMKTLEGLQGINGLRVSVISTVSQINYRELPDLVALLRQKGLFSHGINILRGQTADEELRLPERTDLEWFLGTISETMTAKDYRWKGPLGPLFSRLHNRYVRRKWSVVLATLESRRQIIPCRAGRNDLVIYANGDVAPCEMRPAVGNIRRQSLTGILSGPEMATALAGICGGECSCTHECNLLDSTLFSTRSFVHMIAGRK